MRTFDLSPFYRSTIGFDPLFDLLDNERPDWPPYDIEKLGDDQYRISMAVAGFKQVFNLADHVKVATATMEDGMLSIGLQREVPEQLKPRKIEIGAQTPSAA